MDDIIAFLKEQEENRKAEIERWCSRGKLKYTADGEAERLRRLFAFQLEKEPYLTIIRFLQPILKRWRIAILCLVIAHNTTLSILKPDRL